MVARGGTALRHLDAGYPHPVPEDDSGGDAGAHGRARVVAGEYLATLRPLLDAIDLDAVAAAVAVLRDARGRGARVFIAGNGGSAATAAHLANDLGKATKGPGARPVRAMCLTDNAAWLTALANDEGYARVFTGQLENFAEEGDVLVVITASGSSPNVVEAVAWAREHGLATIGLLGFDGGALRDRVDVRLLVETPRGLYGPVESTHVVLCDLLTSVLIDDVAPGR